MKPQVWVLGESIAERWLASQGWSVVDRRFRSGHRDIDLVIQREETVAFVEVKTRRRVDFGDPAVAVDWRKQRELRRSAAVWVDRFGRPGLTYRFDVVAVVVRDGRAAIRHVEGAFQLPFP